MKPIRGSFKQRGMSPIDVPCPFCLASANERCRVPSVGAIYGYHAERKSSWANNMIEPAQQGPKED